MNNRRIFPLRNSVDKAKKRPMWFIAIATLALWVWTWVCVRDPRTVYWLFGMKAYVLWNYARYVIYSIAVMVLRDGTYVPTWNKFWKQYLYGDVKECWNRPVHSGPGRKIKIAERYKSMATLPIVETGKILDCINMGSYNYLGTGGRCVSDVVWNSDGYSDRWMLQTEVELAMAAFLEKEYCIVLPTGYGTNSSLIPCIIDLCGHDDGLVIFSDSMNHTSIIRGIQSCETNRQSLRCHTFPHNDISALERRIRVFAGDSPVLIIVEGLYSMEGDYAHLRELVKLKSRCKNDVFLYVDEAHSIGALGKTGRGICEHLNVRPTDIDFLMGTFTKSFASIGGYITFQDKELGIRVEQLYHQRFAKGIVPLHASCSKQILEVLKWLDETEGKENIKKLRSNSIYLRKKLKSVGCDILGRHDSPVVPVMVREVHYIEEINRLFLKCGFAVVSVGYPATPLLEGCRLRFCVSATHKEKDLDELVDIMDQSMERFKMLRFPTDTPFVEEEEEEEVVEKMFPIVPLLKREPFLIKPVVEEPFVMERRSFSSRELDEDSLEILKTYGCGSCGPRGFYGTMTTHIALEKTLASFYEKEDAALYAHGQCVASSVIPQLVNTLGGPKLVSIVLSPKDWIPRYDIYLALRLSKAAVSYGGVTKSTRHILVITPDFDSDIDIVKGFDKKNGYTWLVDEFERPFGDTKAQSQADVILGTFETEEMGGMGGFCVGRSDLVEPQRLYSKSYVFSASLPPYLCQLAIGKIKEMDFN